MTRLWASLGSLVFFILAPGTIAGFVPWWLTRWRIGPPFFGIDALRWVGAALIVLGLLPLFSSFARFAWDGLGTPAPIAPPTNLVVTGFYRRVRKPNICRAAHHTTGRGAVVRRRTGGGVGRALLALHVCSRGDL